RLPTDRYTPSRHDALPIFTWDENGRMRTRGKHDHGVLSGVWTFWFDDGKKMAEGAFHRGRSEGTWTYWYPGGVSAAQGKFHLGQDRKRTRLNSSANISYAD